jgi:hypothetical protein
VTVADIINAMSLDVDGNLIINSRHTWALYKVDHHSGRAMSTPLDSHTLDQLFRKAQTFNGFMPLLVSDETVQALYELVKWGPTAFNS